MTAPTRPRQWIRSWLGGPAHQDGTSAGDDQTGDDQATTTATRDVGSPATGTAATSDQRPVRRRRHRAGPLRWFVRLVAGALLIGTLVVAGTGLRVWQVARTDDRTHADVVVVLGAAQYDGRPSDVLLARLEHARALYQAGVAPVVVTAGGRRAGDEFSEGDAGRNWLIGHGVPADRAVAIGTGGDTLATMHAVADEARARGWHSTVVVSDPWHSLRARTMARDAGLAAWTSPTHSGPVVQSRGTQARYILRETAAMLYYHVTHASAETPETGLG
jgi:uncharacterized SAM-binding protein YcdF (DUF218 family)